ncbi:succinate dehydrogenase cytochrome b subunit [Ruania halotolerans]|uniref:succinate dehydrogenase cytochrome b subunit n=1 Tax=Ruania halotolerans TaxID=2897773 RepID=UPI001E5076B2|nr:succinate dehydrogenase cytochrome b subunit [Ruania halotolerans]UFU08336.1 succinate dehydrogenase cytochrome b subunit [Ruania halotolerans]
MRTVTSSPRTPVWRSTVVLKVAMAISGLVLVGFLLAHMYGNLKVFAGQEAFDEYAHHLRELGEPMLPYAGALWLIRIGLLAAIGVHIFSAVTLWRRARAATGGKGGSRYASTQAKRGSQRGYASFTMRWGGVVIILFTVYHLMHFTWNNVAPGGASDSPYERVVNGFEIWWVVLSYTVALLAVGFHLRHGIWAGLASLGANTSQRRRRQLNLLATVVAVVITVGFLLPPFGIFFGLVG